MFVIIVILANLKDNQTGKFLTVSNLQLDYIEHFGNANRSNSLALHFITKKTF